MLLLAIDPGCAQSACVIYDTNTWEVKCGVMRRNDIMLQTVLNHPADHLAVEMVASYGMPVGKSVFDTVFWIGRFCQAWGGDEGETFTRVYRKDIKMHLCHSMRAKDGNIRQALIDRYKPTGGGKNPQIGTKKQPGPLYGVSKDIWSALAVSAYFGDVFCREIGNVTKN